MTRQVCTAPPVACWSVQATSDGRPADEKAAAVAAQPHPSILPVLADIAGGPLAMAMPLLDMRVYGVLARPPSFSSVSRDTYPATTRFRSIDILTTLSGIAAALASLASRGIVHGDIYGHNILVPNGACGDILSSPPPRSPPPLLTDFGAAWFAPAAVAAAARAQCAQPTAV